MHGIELIAAHTQGTFTGYTTGGLSAAWLATVNHTPLNPSARITGGTFTLTTAKHLDQPITTHIAGGTITNTNPGANCTKQTYTVTGNLAPFNHNHTASFQLILTHWRHAILGTCLSYFATTTGTLTITQ